MNFDVFNGDADGICALLQLRLAEPADSILVTGVKRDISLLKRVDAKAGDRVNVLDISLDKNRQPLMDLLDRRVEVFY
ncbi:MAG: DHH family phosphoesterase, partial [Methylomonas sp.]|nr:DHH family phosphoesterase [Methylomonas sp.]